MSNHGTNRTNHRNRADRASHAAGGPSGRPAAYWAPLAWTADGIRRNVRITVTGGTIARIETDADPKAGDHVLHGMVVPGAANCHSHTFHRALRGLGGEGATFWSWRETMYRVAANLTPDRYYRYARAVYTEMLLAGYTTVAEFHYVHHRPDGTPYGDPNAMGRALIDAARDAGIRITLLDTCYLHAGVDGSPLSAAQARFGDGSAQAWRDRVEALDASLSPDARRMARIGAAAHSVRACSPAEAAVVADWTRAGGEGSAPRPLHVHLSEQPAENRACMEATGRTPAQLLDSIGFWGPNAVAVHATHLTDDGVATLARSGASVAMCPTTEADLADGIGPAAALRDAGVPLCVGSDENVSIDPFEEVRRLDGHQRLVSGKRDGFMPAELMAIMTLQGQRAAGWPECGVIAEGRAADFIAIDTASPRTAGARPDSLPLVATGADVEDVVVAGRHVVAGHQHRDGEPAQAIAAITTRLREADKED